MTLKNIDSWLVLRIGLSITFIWVGYMIITAPLVWGSYISSWVLPFIPIELTQFMITTGIFDIIVGFGFLFNRTVFWSSVFGAIHLAGILIVSGINEATVRDIGLLGGTVSLLIKYLPRKLLQRIND